MSVKEFAAKYSSKREVYNFLAVDMGVYVPGYGKQFRWLVFLTSITYIRAGKHLLPQGPVQWHEEA